LAKKVRCDNWKKDILEITVKRDKQEKTTLNINSELHMNV